MSGQTELPLSGEGPTDKRPPRQVWHLVTNQLNLMYMLAAGLVTGPKGLGRKYYRDPLCVAPGWIPLFGDRLPAAALAQATEEGRHLEPVAATVDLSALRGPIQAIDGHGQLRQLHWPDQANGDEQVLFIPAPLPVVWLTAILFPSRKAKSSFAEQVAELANVPAGAFKQQVKLIPFQSGPTPAWPPEGDPPPDRDRSPHRVSALGAVQAVLTQLGNRGGALVEAARVLADPTDTPVAEIDDPLLRAIHQWACGADASNDEVQTRILAGLLATIVGGKSAADGDAGAGCTPDAQQAVLDTLDAERQRLTEPKWQEALTRLIADLEGLLGLGDATISQLLERHPRPFSRGLILFFLRRHCDELQALAADQPLLSEQDLVIAAALYGARDGWIGLSQSLKDTPGLTAATTSRMAVAAHREQASGVDLGPLPPRVRPLLELLQPGDDGWTARQLKGAVDLARRMAWRDILETKISLGKGDYRLTVDGSGAHLLLNGDVKAVQTEADPVLLLRALANARIPTKVEAAIRSALKP